MGVPTVLAILCLFAASATLAHAQVSCYNIMTCGGVGTTFPTARECCLSDNTVAYDDGTGCIQCIVFGWVQSTIVGNESSRDVQEAEMGYIKGSGGRIAVTLSFIDAPSGTPSARETDVMITTPNPTIPPSSFPRFIFRMSFSADSIAQEGTEHAILRLALADNSGAPAGGFLKSDLELVISDQDMIVIEFDQEDYANNEVDLLMPLSVTKNLILANPVSLQILPVTVAQAGSRLPANLPLDDRLSPNRAKITPEDRRDFSSDVLTVTFPADELVGNDMIVNQIRRTIALVDDAIDEADVEFFVILLEVTDAIDPNLINLRRNVALGRISDNDQITIGFEFESYTFTEPLFEMEVGFNVFLVKENDVITEQIYPIVFRLSNSAPNNSIQVATGADSDSPDYEVNIDVDNGAVIEFPASEQRLQVFGQQFTFLLLPDTAPEGTEAFQVTTGPGEVGPRYIPPAASSEVFANSFMIILDDDMITIGWVNTSFTVREDIGTFEACYRVFVPTPEDSFDQPIIMVVDTRAGTADDNDYLQLVSGEESFVNDTIRERCATITIKGDNVFEETEQFSIELSESQFSSVNPQVIPNLANITIVDTTRLMIGFIGAPYQAGEDMGPMVFIVGVIGGTTLADGVEVVVSFSTVGQAPPGRELATDGSDFVGRSNVLLTFNSATREIQVPVNLIDDSVFEMEEGFTGTLTLISSSVGTERVSIGPQTAVATIVDDEIVCQELGAFENGRIEYSPDMTALYDEGTVATHICNPGFALVGNVNRTCQNDSSFDGTPPTCEPIECEPLPSIQNGFIIYTPDNTANYSMGTIATYNCDSNFILDLSGGGSRTRQCIDDGDGDVLGVFDRQAPTCRSDIIRINDTVTGDPLFTVPLNVPDKSAIMNLGDDDPLNLCFEVHGQNDAFFNLVSDGCVSVNAHYSQVHPNEDINVIDRIYVRASNTGGVCRNIEVSLDQCSAGIDGTSVDNYMSEGISVRRYRNRVRIAVPNCDDIELVMWVFCLNTTFWSRASTEQNEIIFVAEMIRFVIARGLDLDERSHGIIGQYWNVPIQVTPYTGPVRPGESSDGYYIITTNHPDEGSRQFIGWLWPLTWEYRSEYCLYAGQNQGGPVYEILDDTVNNWVLFGSYSDYRVNSAYDTNFAYSHFNETQC